VLATWLQSRLPKVKGWLLTGLAVLIALPAMWLSLDHKVELLKKPLASDVEKHVVRLGPRYEAALFLSTLPPHSKIWVKDILLPYHVDGMQVFTGLAPSFATFCTVDFWVRTPGEALPAYLTVSPMQLINGYEVYPTAEVCRK
jgi:hypothetical protein